MNDLRRRFVNEAVSTASPMALLLMLMDRLVLDVDRADLALETGDRPAASTHIMHAEQIIDALRTSLDPAAWEGAARLGAVYDYLFSRLVTANVRGDREVLDEVRGLVGPLREAWAEASASVEGMSAFAAPKVPAAYAGIPVAAGASGGLLGVA